MDQINNLIMLGPNKYVHQCDGTDVRGDRYRRQNRSAFTLILDGLQNLTRKPKVLVRIAKVL